MSLSWDRIARAGARDRLILRQTRRTGEENVVHDRDELKQRVSETIERHADEIIGVGETIRRHPSWASRS
jgi:hypothetical protein